MEIDLSDRCWKDEDGWMTDFPPPPGFTGYQKGDWRGFRYERACTPEEEAILEADEAAVEAEQLADEERLRDTWFRTLAESRQAATEYPAAFAGSVTRAASHCPPPEDRSRERSL